MRSLFPATLFAIALGLGAHAATPLPDQPTVSDLAAFRAECDSTAATILLADRTGQTAKATEMHVNLWERYDAELFARRAVAADLSLATVNPWLTPAERAAAETKLKQAAAELTELSTFAMPDPATRDQLVAKRGLDVTALIRERAQAYLALQQLRTSVQLDQLTHRQLAERRRKVVTRLETLASSAQPLDAAITDARDLPLAAEIVRGATATFADGYQVEKMFRYTSASLALDATLTKLIEADPANLVFWLARARARFALGWRSAAVVDLSIASHFQPDHPGVATLRDRIRAVPAQVASIWQEAIDHEDVHDLTAARRVNQTAGNAQPQLVERLERTARAALRNRNRRLYACSFIGKTATRVAALRYTSEENQFGELMVPTLPTDLIARYEAEGIAAGSDARALFAVQHRYAPILGNQGVFWFRHLQLFLAARESNGGRVAAEVARTLFPAEPWVKELTEKLNELPALPASEKK